MALQAELFFIICRTWKLAAKCAKGMTSYWESNSQRCPDVVVKCRLPLTLCIVQRNSSAPSAKNFTHFQVKDKKTLV